MPPRGRPKKPETLPRTEYMRELRGRKHRLDILLEPETAARLKTMADAAGKTPTDLARTMIESHIARET